MHKFIKVGLACIRDNKLLLCRAFAFNDLLLPGGQRDGSESDIECLSREITEELGEDATIDTASLQYMGRFEDVAAFHKDTIVEITLYVGHLLGELRASSEIKELVWFSLGDDPSVLSPIVRNHIVPALEVAGLLTKR
jgi:8-oxo-dGTP diphosphatase